MNLFNQTQGAPIQQTVQPTQPTQNANGLPLTPVQFDFRPKEVDTPMLNDQGQPVYDATGQIVMTKAKVKQPSLTFDLPTLTVDNLLSIPTTPEQETAYAKWLVDLVNSEIKSAAQGMINAAIKDGKTISAEIFNFAELNPMYLATKPKAERVGISKEIWSSFGQDFMKVLIERMNISADGAANLNRIVTIDRLQHHKANETVLKVVQQRLDQAFSFFDDNQKATYSDIYEDMSEKIKTYLESGMDSLLAKLI